ncbi:rod shape-determining protein [Spiroplasma taiwanense]|uniref:Cell shape determining protein MreB n=1 Tax=Spiroplasma taiwanense CT-1 TaxID=1276220 RepID=S5LV76_9MOLU|nr:rod shape-determining protein [Spiroplasma taiwanense]AGR41679.1 cell shape determining protein MreB [Spiroplasma taiwanense CT-1]
MAKTSLRSRKHIAIDIGTSKTRIYIEGLGIVFNEASLIATDYKTKKIIAIGNTAKNFIGKLNGSLQIKYLLKKGTVTDLNLLKVFLFYILRKYENEIKGSVVTLACPTSLTSLERKSLIDSIKSLGVFYINVEDDIKLALYGAGVDITKPEGYLCLDMGAGKTTAGIIVTGGTINSKWTKAAGISIDNEIIKYLKSKHGMMIGELTAEAVKISIASLIKMKQPLKTKAYGYDLGSAMPKELELSDTEISKVLLATFGNITDTITSLLEEAPNEVAGDIIKNGLFITGGLSNVHGVKTFFENFFEIPVKIPKNSNTAVIDGAIAHKELTMKKIEIEMNPIQENNW